VPVRRYVLAQFMVAIVLVLLIGDLYAKAGANAVLLPCLLLWAQLYTMGLLNEGRAYATRLEAARLALLVPGATGLIIASSVVQGDASLLWTVAGVYVVISLMALLFVYQRIQKKSQISIKTDS